jgi:hypothetical protein
MKNLPIDPARFALFLNLFVATPTPKRRKRTAASRA